MAATFPTLDQIDPAEAWQPWQPTLADPWGRKWAAHLYRRAAFGHSREDLLEAERLGPDGTLDLLLAGSPTPRSSARPWSMSAGSPPSDDDGGDQLRGWWLYCMLQGGHPLREKLTLFWHNHFATSLAKVQYPTLMFRQNCLLRDHALGRFGPLLQAISRDGAMLVWLDSNSNVKGKPNENYARELMELFSLGVGNYTEKDIREAARAFTGWRTDGDGLRVRRPLARQRPQDGPGPNRRLGRRRRGAHPSGAARGGPIPGPQALPFLVSEKSAPPDCLLEPLVRVVSQERLRYRRAGPDHPGLAAFLLGSRLPAAGQGTGGIRAGGRSGGVSALSARTSRTTGRCRSGCSSVG